MPARPLVQAIYYPESDGKPMGETDWHRKEIVRLIELLERYYAGQQVYVTGDLLVYYEQGNPKKFLVPDVFVVKDLIQKERRIFRLWVENRIPSVIIEVTSRKTRKKDTIDKPQQYAAWGVKEYFVFDPDSDYLDPPLQGYRLWKAGYRRIVKDAEGCLMSQELGLKLALQASHVQLINSETGERLLTGQEEADRLKQETALIKEEAAQVKQEAAQLEEENRRLRAELAKRKSSR